MRPLKGWRFAQGLGGEGSLFSEFLQSLTLYYNQSEYADYNSNYVEAPPSATLSASVTANGIVISWAPAGGKLQSCTALGGAWSDVGTANPSAAIPMAGTAMFFRVIP